jgi:hypothetical protein
VSVDRQDAGAEASRTKGRETAIALVILIVVAGIVVWGLAVIPGLGITYIQCDGTVPAWMVPDDYDGRGCVELRPSSEGLLPENSDHSDYCLGLCTDLAPPEAGARRNP